MVGFFLKPNSKGHHARSISLPVRSHPTTLKIKEELNKLRNLEVCSSNCFDFTKLRMAIPGLAELYKSIGDLLKLPQTQQALNRHNDSSWVDEILEESISFLDVCENIRENLFLLRKNIAQLQSSLRRRNNVNGSSELDNDNEDAITKYASFVKKLKREMGKFIVSLKQIDNKLLESSIFNKINNNQYVIAIVRVLRETSLICNFVFRSICWYFSSTNSHLLYKGSKWGLVLKLVQNNNKGQGEDELNELEDVEAVLNNLMVRKMSADNTRQRVQVACKKLHALDTTTQGFEKDLECLFRQLIHTRVSLLNLLSDH
ncbi:uncharacterized protein LOC130820883 [Amaranthus tricolor]|uniref:uncharacterized protein LOC130820883 n=1 Tax=Amaranthus tricolor TaxID=29722 RepID=UPI002588F5AD|nr:uncharacterized protein LOC130820883 [Amaranthus tricolor]